MKNTTRGYSRRTCVDTSNQLLNRGIEVGMMLRVSGKRFAVRHGVWYVPIGYSMEVDTTPARGGSCPWLADSLGLTYMHTAGIRTGRHSCCRNQGAHRLLGNREAAAYVRSNNKPAQPPYGLRRNSLACVTVLQHVVW